MLDQHLPPVALDQLLWVDVTGREQDELTILGRFLTLEDQSIAELRSSKRTFGLSNFGQYVMFDVLSLCPEDGKNESVGLRTPRSTRLDFLFNEQWLLTVHDDEVSFLRDFRAQDRGETLIGQLSPASLAAALLDSHLNRYLTAIESFETFVEGLDVRLLARRTLRKDLLGQLVGGSRYVASLRRTLAPQRTVFYGLSRPDFTLIAASNAASHFSTLERRFERTLDATEHARELIKGSFELLSTRVTDTTNVLIRRLTFMVVAAGAISLYKKWI